MRGQENKKKQIFNVRKGKGDDASLPLAADAVGGKVFAEQTQT